MSIEYHRSPRTAPAQEFGDDAELEALYRDLAAVDLQPLWTITEQLLTPTPQPAAVPWLWSAAHHAAAGPPGDPAGPGRARRRAAGAQPAEPRARRPAVRRRHAVGRDTVPRPARDRSGAPAHPRRDPLRARGRGRLDDGQRRRLRHAPRRPGPHPVDELARPHQRAATARCSGSTGWTCRWWRRSTPSSSRSIRARGRRNPSPPSTTSPSGCTPPAPATSTGGHRRARPRHSAAAGLPVGRHRAWS